ncbi:MAG: hypothetical protein ACT4PL_08925 [Phycisphaerales bacterium]
MALQLLLWDWLRPLARAVGAVGPGPKVSAKAERAGPGQSSQSGRSVRQRRPGAGLVAGAVSAVAIAKPRRAGGGRGGAGAVLARGAGGGGVQGRYDELVRRMLAQYSIRVRKWRRSMSGVAWRLDYADGRSVNLLESPRPKGPMSMAVFLHEVGHHAIGLGVHKPRCLEEYLAWKWSLETMEREGLNITESVRYRMRLSLWYAVSKARRRGLRELPADLMAYVSRPERRTMRTEGEC